MTPLVKTMELDAAKDLIDDPRTTAVGILAVVSEWVRAPESSRESLAVLLHAVIGRLRAETTCFQPDFVALDTHSDPAAMAQAATALRSVVREFMPAVTALVDAGAPVSYEHAQDYAILDAVVQVFSPELIAYFLEQGAELSPGFAERLAGRGREHMRRVLAEARDRVPCA